MYKLVLAGVSALFMAAAACAQPNQTMNSTQPNPRILVACFSATGTTARIAEKVTAATGGTLYAITPAEPYTAADLDWTDKRSRSSREMNDPKARPEIGGEKIDMTRYEVIFVGYPIWWDLAPRIVETFLDRYDLGGKTVIPFATSGGSGISNSAAALKKAYPQAAWRPGRLLNRAGDAEVRAWVEQVLKVEN